MYCNKTLRGYLDDLAARLPAPGGGSAAALTASEAAALVSMVINFTVGKPRYARYEPQLKAALEESEKLRSEFLRLVDLDVTAYASKNLRDALGVPFMVCRLCFEGIRLCPPLITRSNQNLISDVAVAAIFFEAAFAAAYFNVEINLKALGDKKLARSIRKEMLVKAKKIRKIRLEMEDKVGKIIRG
ncbi:MAG: cyclodeaminase/cyclohydrolase family protein [Candidatus Omnitrophota bacterium]